MAGRTLCLVILVASPVILEAWTSREMWREQQPTRRQSHNHAKRHMLPVQEPRKRSLVTTVRTKEFRKKSSGHLARLEEDDMDNDEGVQVAIGPPPIRPKYEKIYTRPRPQNNSTTPSAATRLIQEVLTQLGQDFIMKQVNEDFVFGQYIGNAMRSLAPDVRLKMQHEILELVLKYQKKGKEEKVEKLERPNSVMKNEKVEKKFLNTNETEDGWPDFTNLAKIVG